MFSNFLKKDYKKIAGLHLLAIFFIILDRWLKVWALAAKPLSNTWLSFNFNLNPNLAFSLPLPPALIMIIVGLVIIGLWFYYFKLLAAGQWTAGLVFAIILGALSNLVDRALYGGVIDYFSFAGLTVFNLADALLTLGLGAWLAREILYGNRPATATPPDKLEPHG